MVDLDKFVTLSSSNEALVEELRATREEIKSLKAREAKIRSILLQELAGKSVGVTASGRYVVEIQNQPRTKVDTARLQALHYEVWEDCQAESEVQVLRLLSENDEDIDSYIDTD